MPIKYEAHTVENAKVAITKDMEMSFGDPNRWNLSILTKRGFWKQIGMSLARWEAEEWLPEGTKLPTYTRKRGQFVKVGEDPKPYKAEFTADQWELYSDKPGAAGAASKINKALTKAINKALDAADKLDADAFDDLDDGRGPLHKLAAKARDEVYAVMNTVSGFGAMDTEPSCNLTTFIERALGLPSYSLSR